MVLTRASWALLVVVAEAARPQWLDPTYHFRRAENHMNDPNVRSVRHRIMIRLRLAALQLSARR